MSTLAEKLETTHTTTGPARVSILRSIGTQPEILDAIQALHCPDGFECDVTYGNGSFYKGRSPGR